MIRGSITRWSHKVLPSDFTYGPGMAIGRLLGGCGKLEVISASTVSVGAGENQE
jgi:hypothetical protein